MTVETGVGEIEDIVLGATVLGTGGGGDPHADKPVAKQAIKEFGPVELLPPDELGADDFVIPTAQMGTPTVSVKKLPSRREAAAPIERIERELGKTADATMPVECDGVNSVFPFVVAARRRLPVVNTDGMEHAFLEPQCGTFNTYGASETLAAVSDEQGGACLIETEDNGQSEWLARGITAGMGGVAYVSDYPMTGAQVSETTIPGTMSLAKDLGRVLWLAEGDVMGAIHEVARGSIYGEAWSLFEEEIADVQRRIERGFVFSHVDIDSPDGNKGSTMHVEPQNENLGTAIDGGYVVTVPGLITVLDREMGGPILTENLRYGTRVRVFGIRTPEIMRTSAALGVWGPALFGLGATYESLAGHPQAPTFYI